MKNIKNLREFCQYLKSSGVDRTRIWRKCGDVLTVSEEALKQEMEKAGQRSQKGSVIGCCTCGGTYPSRDKRGGDRRARRERQRANRERFRENRLVSGALARALNPLQGGSAPRITETPSKLQILQQYAVAGSEDGRKIWSEKDQAIYVGISSPTDRLATMDEKNREKTAGKDDKKGDITVAGNKQLNKSSRSVSDGLLLVVTARINGHSV